MFSATATITAALTLDPVTMAENAIQEWVVTGSGLDADHVIWAGDGPSGPQPEGCYISMRIVGDDTASEDWMLPRRDGSTIRYRVRSHHQATVELSCNAGGSFGSARAGMVLRRVIAASTFPSVVESMKAANIGMGPVGKIRLIPGLRSGLLDPKAMVEVGIHMEMEIGQPAAGSAIETVEVSTETEAGIRSGTVG